MNPLAPSTRIGPWSWRIFDGASLVRLERIAEAHCIRDRSRNRGGIQAAFRTMELLRAIQAGDVAQRMLMDEGIEAHAGGGQMMGQHLTKTSVRGVFFHHEQPASCGGRWQ